MVKQPAHQIIRQVPCEIIQDQHHAQGRFGIARRMTQPCFPTCTGRALGFGRQFCSWGLLLDLSQDLRELFFEPGMQDRVGRRDDAFGTQVARGRTEQGQQFGSASTLVLMRLQDGMALGLPVRSWLWDGLIRSGFILIELDDPCCLCLLARELD